MALWDKLGRMGAFTGGTTDRGHLKERKKKVEPKWWAQGYRKKGTASPKFRGQEKEIKKGKSHINGKKP